MSEVAGNGAAIPESIFSWGEELNALYAGKHGADTNNGKKIENAFLTIQAAINSVTDATSIKKYVIYVGPGDYAENVVAKDYVFLVGADTAATRVTGSSGTLLTCPANNFRLQNIGLILTNAATGSKCLDATAGGIHVIQNYEMTIQTATNGAVCYLMDIDCTLFIGAESSFAVNSTGSSAGANLKQYIRIGGTTELSLARFALTINDADVDDTVVGIFDGSTGRTDIRAESIIINMTNGAYTGIAAAFAPFGTGSSVNTARIGNLAVTSSGGGTGYGVYFDSGASGVSELREGTIKTFGFDNNYSYYVALNDTLYTSGMIIDAALDGNIVGTARRLDYDIQNDIWMITGDTDVDGRVTEQGTLADIHVHDNATAQSIPAGATYAKSTVFADNGFSKNCTADAANDKITFTKTGLYKVDGSFSFASGTNNVTFFGSVFLNGVEQDQIHWTRKVATAGDVGSASFTGFIDVTTVGWDLDFRIRHDQVGAINLTISYANLNVSYLGET